MGMAGGLARAGILRELVVPWSEVMDGAFGTLARAPGPVGARLRAELSRRPLPPGLLPSQVTHRAALLEAGFVAAKRLTTQEPLIHGLERQRDRLFDHCQRRRLAPDDLCVVATYRAALHTLRRARRLGVRSFVYYPSTHHSAAERILAEEARLRPAFARTLDFHRLPASLKRRLDDEIAAADHVIVLSTPQARAFLDEGIDQAKLVQVPLGVDLETFRPHARPDDEVFRVAWVGQLTQSKGLSYFFEAARIAKVPNLELMVVGAVVGSDSPWRDEPRLRYVPPQPRARLPPLYGSADVYVLPSLAEGFPQTALEAMACGVPVIVSENTFGRDVITDGVEGYVVPIRDPLAIAERLRYLAANPDDRARMGAAARRRAEDFSLEEYGNRVVAAITAACA